MSDKRSDIDEKYKWDLSTVFATDETWEAELAKLDADLEDAKKTSLNYIENKYKELKKFLEETES